MAFEPARRLPFISARACGTGSYSWVITSDKYLCLPHRHWWVSEELFCLLRRLSLYQKLIVYVPRQTQKKRQSLVLWKGISENDLSFFTRKQPLCNKIVQMSLALKAWSRSSFSFSVARFLIVRGPQQLGGSGSLNRTAIPQWTPPRAAEGPVHWTAWIPRFLRHWLPLPGGPKMRNPGFNFAITSVNTYRF